jgi:hypothetical protein
MRLNRDPKHQPAKSPLAAAAASRRIFPAWIDAGTGPAFVAIVTPRVRDGLILRLVAQAKPGAARNAPDVPRAR